MESKQTPEARSHLPEAHCESEVQPVCAHKLEDEHTVEAQSALVEQVKPSATKQDPALSVVPVGQLATHVLG